MRVFKKFTSILLIFAFLSSAPAVVFASQGQLLQAEPSKVAMQALGLAKHYYAQGKFEKAAELFMEAYRLDSRVEFMFNAARAYQRAINLTKAKQLFNRCVKAKDTSPVVVQKATIYLREIQNMERALSKAKHEGEKKAVKVVTKPKPKRKKIVVPKDTEWRKRAGTWSLAASAILGTVSGWLLITSYEYSNSADLDAKEKEITYEEYSAAKDKAELYSVIGWSLSGVAAVGAAFGIWGITTGKTKIRLAPTANGATLMVRF